MNTLHITTNNEQHTTSASTVDVHFDGFMEAAVRCEVVKEMVKFVLYETGQIPMVFNQIKDFSKQDKIQIEDASKKTALVGRASMQRIVPSPQVVLIESVNNLCDTIHQVFGSGGLGKIQQVLFILGNSVSLPRHSVLLNLPSSSTSEGGEVIKAAASLRTLFHALMVEDLLYGAQARGAALTKLFVLFLAPRGANAQRIGLQPCLTFKLPGLRGKLYTINLLCAFKELTKKKSDLDLSSDWEESEHAGKDGDDLELSGIVPFSPFPKPFQRPSFPDKDENEKNGEFKVPQNPGPIVSDQLKVATNKMSLNGSLEQTHSTPKNVTSLASVTCVQGSIVSNEELSTKDCDFIWYQASVVIKGYTEKQLKGGF